MGRRLLAPLGQTRCRLVPSCAPQPSGRAQPSSARRLLADAGIVEPAQRSVNTILDWRQPAALTGPTSTTYIRFVPVGLPAPIEKPPTGISPVKISFRSFLIGLSLSMLACVASQFGGCASR